MLTEVFMGFCRTNWKLKEIAKSQDGTYELYYDTPDGSQKVS